jgi:hypothetical protein
MTLLFPFFCSVYGNSYQVISYFFLTECLATTTKTLLTATSGEEKGRGEKKIQNVTKNR